jgi:hypothetical protein
MPRIEDILKKTDTSKKPFKKVAYRPWENSFIEESVETEKPKESEKPVAEVLPAPKIALGVNSKFKIQLVSGNARTILVVLSKNIESVQEDWNICKDFSTEQLSELTGIKNNVLNTCIYRLKKLNYIRSFESKKGKGGFIFYGIRNDVAAEVVNYIKKL